MKRKIKLFFSHLIATQKQNILIIPFLLIFPSIFKVFNNEVYNAIHRMQWNSRSYKIMSFNSVLLETSCINGEFIEKKILNVNQLILPEYWKFNWSRVLNTYLCWKDDKCYTYHNNHIKLRWPYIRNKISITNGAECDHNIICTLK